MRLWVGIDCHGGWDHHCRHAWWQRRQRRRQIVLILLQLLPSTNPVPPTAVPPCLVPRVLHMALGAVRVEIIVHAVARVERKSGAVAEFLRGG